jgi:NTE family protein
MQKAWMGDARLGVVAGPRIRLADAVAASASFPPVVAPFWLALPKDGLLEIPGADLYPIADETGLAEKVLLLDGGAYDNLGVEPLEGRSRIVLASSAGGELKVDTRRSPYRWMWPLLRRTLDMAVEVGRVQRRRALIDRATAASQLPADADFRQKHKTEHVALWRTTNDLASAAPERPEAWVPQPSGCIVAPGWNEYLASLPTRLWPMPVIDRHRLVNWGYLTSDVMLRSYVPELRDEPEPVRLPIPEADFRSRPPLR